MNNRKRERKNPRSALSSRIDGARTGTDTGIPRKENKIRSVRSQSEVRSQKRERERERARERERERERELSQKCSHHASQTRTGERIAYNSDLIEK